MVVVPAPTGVTAPVPDTIVATEGILLLHVPPGVVQLIVSVPDRHIADVPVIAAGSVFTVIVLVEMHPDGIV
jgi:hypothetical protein